jgi:NDP-sugar pyrophosphorylase family protein
MILAAGYGTRLWPLTLDRAKPAIPFMGRPLVGYVAEYLAGHGCREIAVNLHHEPESVRAALGDGSRFGVSLTYVEEPEILGTSGALDNARDFFHDETFVVVNGKIATDIDLTAALRTHRETDALATLVLRPNHEREKYSTVEIRDRMILGFGGYPGPAPASDKAGGVPRASPTASVSGDSSTASVSGGSPTVSTSGDSQTASAPVESQTAGASQGSQAASPVQGSGAFITREPRPQSGYGETPLMFTGIHILAPRIFDYVPRGVFSDSVTGVYPRAFAAGERIAAHVAGGYWHELSTIARYLDTSIALMREQGRKVELGENSVVSDGAEVTDAVLWENVRVEAGGRVSRAVLGAGVRVPAGEVIADAAVVRAELVAGAERPEKALAGEVRGANFVVPLAR